MGFETPSGETELLVGFFDLAGYARWCEGRAPAESLDLATELFARTGADIAVSGGRLVKAIGDAGLFVFPPDDPDAAVEAMVEIKHRTDAWLAERNYPGAMTVKMNAGPVACGPVGAPGREHADVYGPAVNRAAMLKGRGVVITPELHARLSSRVREMFAEHPNTGAFLLEDSDGLAG